MLAQTIPEMPEGVLSAERLAEKHTEEEMNGQWSLFEGSQPLKIDKPIRLIELFAGYGSQALAMSDEDYTIPASVQGRTTTRGDKISQLVVMPVLYEDVEVVSELNETDRGDNGFGSTGR